MDLLERIATAAWPYLRDFVALVLLLGAVFVAGGFLQLIFPVQP